MNRKSLVPVLAFLFVVTLSASSQAPPQERLDDAMIAKIKSEGMERSKIMWIEHYLTGLLRHAPDGDGFEPFAGGEPPHRRAQLGAALLVVHDLGHGSEFISNV